MTHEDRLALIHRPFFITHIGRSYNWAGAAAGDTFYATDGEKASRLPVCVDGWAARPSRRLDYSEKGTEGGGVLYISIKQVNNLTRTYTPR